VCKVLEGLTRLKSKADTRLPITTFILNKLVSVLPGICYNKYEDKMFKAAFTLSFVLNDKPCNDKYAMKCVILSVDGGHLFSSP
jgi:hypothetical protein